MSSELYNLVTFCASLVTIGGILLAVIPYIYLARQAKSQRQADYLREQQRDLRQAVAEYDAWILRWQDHDQKPHGAKVCSTARSVMLAIGDPQLDRLAGQLSLYPSSQEDNDRNQQTLKDATMRLARLLV